MLYLSAYPNTDLSNSLTLTGLASWTQEVKKKEMTNICLHAQ